VASDTTFMEVRRKWMVGRKGTNTASVETGLFFGFRSLYAAFWSASMYVSGTITRIPERILSLEGALLERSGYLPLQFATSSRNLGSLRAIVIASVRTLRCKANAARSS
jgi:hypothetical protein